MPGQRPEVEVVQPDGGRALVVGKLDAVPEAVGGKALRIVVCDAQTTVLPAAPYGAHERAFPTVAGNELLKSSDLDASACRSLEVSVRRAALALGVLAAVAVGGCGSPAPTSTATVQVQTDAPTPSATPEPKRVGEQVSNGAITLTVKAASTAGTIELNESGFRPGSGYEKYTKTPAGDGAKFVVVQTHVVNNAKESLDLTCTLPVSTKLVDDKERQFDPIDDLYKIKGNPECNDQLQPGFESDMTWIYRVPATANVVGWAFQDFTEFASTSQWTVVRLQT